jgi:hypothetical protein
VTLSHQLLLVLTALIKSTLQLLLSQATYKLSKDMLLTHVSAAAMKTMLVRLLDFQAACRAEEEEEGEEGGSGGGDDVAGMVQSCIAQLLEVIAMVSTISGGGSSEVGGGSSSGRSGKGKGKASSSEDDAAALFTAEGIISLYFANPNEVGTTDDARIVMLFLLGTLCSIF